EDIPRAIREAFHIASTGRPGPVLVDIPKDILINEAEWSWPSDVDLPGYRPTVRGNPRQVREAVRMILESECPVLYVGGGVITADNDPAEIGKNRAVDVPIVGDAKDVIGSMATELTRRQADRGGPPDRAEWLERLADWQKRFPYRYRQDEGGPIKPQLVVERLYEATEGDAVVVAGVGQHQMWASQYWRFERPRSWINSGGLGTMGFAVPAALGAKV